MRHNKPIRRLVVAIFILLVAGACVQETPAIFIVQNSALDPSCEPSKTATGEVLGAGRMDLTVARSYRMNLLVENLMGSSAEASLGGGGAAGTYEGNRVTFTNALVSIQGPENGLQVALPTDQAIPISGTLEPNTSTVVEMDVIGNALGSQLAAAITRRGTIVPLTVTVRFEGVTTSGTDVESNSFRFPMEVCRGCLLDFPPEADDPDYEQADCLAEQTESTSTEELCFPGQDEPLDCRVCQNILSARSEDTLQCEPTFN